MITANEETIFHPYKIIQRDRNQLQLQAPLGQKFVLFLLWFIPVAMIIAGVVLFMIEKELFLLWVFGGIGALEAIIFSFIKVPALLSLDSMGFTLETVSMRGRSENYYLWNDVAYITYKKVTSKSGTSLIFDTVLNSGKKINFLSFGNYRKKKDFLPQLHSILKEMSKKEIREK